MGVQTRLWLTRPRQDAYDGKPKLANDVNGHILVAAAS